MLVNGASGGVGTYAVQLAKALGAAHVTAVCSTHNVETAARIGADRVVDYTREDATATSERYDLIFDNAGVWPLRTCGRMLADGGSYVMISSPKSRWLHPLPRMIANPLYFMLASGHGPGFKVAARNTADLELLADLATRGLVKPVMDRRFTLDEAPGGGPPAGRVPCPREVGGRALTAQPTSGSSTRKRVPTSGVDSTSTATAVAGDGPLHDRETEAGARAFAHPRVGGAEELLEHPAALVLGDPHPLVLDHELRLRVRAGPRIVVRGRGRARPARST